MELDENTISNLQKVLREAMHSASGILNLGVDLWQEAARYARFQKPILWVEAFPAVCAEMINRLASYQNQKAFRALLERVDGLQRTFEISNNMDGVSSSIRCFFIR